MSTRSLGANLYLWFLSFYVENQSKSAFFVGSDSVLLPINFTLSTCFLHLDFSLWFNSASDVLYSRLRRGSWWSGRVSTSKDMLHLDITSLFWLKYSVFVSDESHSWSNGLLWLRILSTGLAYWCVFTICMFTGIFIFNFNLIKKRVLKPHLMVKMF